ncbi:tetratricopeptide repeat protein [Poseidonocella sp. HB161398]|uniref:tetratricopeptide repeat protein n=1 Tax=Poseidonocella sp. HB161398 TaxID=2320855 RepID=UPI0014861661|nr:tetratricopeptide repeat protein [Poseidonocella sp. HB161398]
MSLTSKLGTVLLSTTLILALAACESDEQKAQKKFESAEALIEAGDYARAQVELRGIFDLTPEFLDARLAYARVQVKLGDLKDAYGQFLLAAQQHPRSFEARVEAAEMSATLGDFDRFDTNLDAALDLEPENPRAKALSLVRQLREARRRSDTARIEQIRDEAQALLDADPTLVHARNALIDAHTALNDPYGTLELLNEAIALYPQEKRYYSFKLQLQNQIDDLEGIGETLKSAVDAFPDDRDFKLALVRWYLRNGDADSAEAFMKADVERKGDSDGPRVEYVQFLQQVKGPEAALAQIDDYIAGGTNNVLFRTLRASTLFDSGRHQEAIDELRTLLDADAVGSDSLVRDARIALARMLIVQGSKDEAAGIVDKVLEADPRHVEALKLQAERLVEEDRVGDAILSLRTAMDQAPDDAMLYTLMARAHEREGNRDLMRENLQLAVEKSAYGSRESQRYARMLMSEDKFKAANDVLIQAARRTPGDLGILKLMAQGAIGTDDWTRAQQIVKSIRAIGSPEAGTLADSLEADILARTQRTDESMELLRGMMENESTAMTAQAAIVRSYLSQGKTAEARSFLDELLAQAPDSRTLRFLDASLLDIEGKPAESAAIFRSLLDENPGQELVWRAYVTTLLRSGDKEAARAALDEGIAAVPDGMNLLWQKAGFEERDGNVEAAIAIYEDLYKRNSNSTIIANNLASLITSYRDSHEDLSHAYTIARRLKGTEVPAFQDTYGWIAFRMGNLEEALPYLQDAATKLTEDPMVQEHFARALAESDRPADAAPFFDRAIALVGDSDPDRVSGLEAARDAALAKADETPN